MIRTMLALLVFPTVALSNAIVHVRSDRPSTVYLDGVSVGAAPLKLTNLNPGTHNIRIVSPTGQAQEFAVYSPRSSTLERDVIANWGQPVITAAAPVPPVVLPPPVVVPPPPVVVAQPPPVIAAAPAYVAPVVVVRPRYRRHYGHYRRYWR
jgi:hypothetical protein